jgi:hypothetical protein
VNDPLQTTYGLFACERCRNGHENGTDPTDDCGDSCAEEWIAELLPLWADADETEALWPRCSCCGDRAQLVTPLLRADRIVSLLADLPELEAA